MVPTRLSGVGDRRPLVPVDMSFVFLCHLWSPPLSLLLRFTNLGSPILSATVHSVTFVLSKGPGTHTSGGLLLSPSDILLIVTVPSDEVGPL